MNIEMMYKVLFTGQFRTDMSIEEIELNIIKLFQVSSSKEIAHFFKSESFIIKRTKSEAKAQQYQTELYKAGLLCDIIAPITNSLFTPPEKLKNADSDWSNLTITPNNKISEDSEDNPR